MRIVFMGTPAFAVAVLRRLVEDGWDIAAVYTQPDKPKNRGMKLQATPVKEYALSQKLTVYQPESCRDAAVLEQLRGLEPDVIVVAAYGKLLPQTLLDIPRTAIINVHSSILPQYRGAAPINWAVLNGDAETGVTIQYMAAELDAGDILLTKTTPIDPEEDAGQLYDRLAVLGGEAASEALSRLRDGTASRTPQVYGPQYQYASLLSRGMSPMDWTRPAQQLINQVRGLIPWPCAVTEAAGVRWKVFRACMGNPVKAEPGTVLSAGKDGIEIACGDGNSLFITELQAAGGKRMAAADYLRGHPLKL
ncbi:MAG: methionyl-tRNA formyltransferase [Oscillospiraceae bacterium]|nr:methionyl-tRNA formyltransferase [Oscillospiraceae bacterium]